jgi:hypothetical protein
MTPLPEPQIQGRVFRDADGKPMRPPALRQLTDPAMHAAGGRVEQHAADMRAYYEASGEAPSPVAQKGCTGCVEGQPNQLAHMEPGGCLYTEE